MKPSIAGEEMTGREHFGEGKMKLNDLPPGVNASDIPGNQPENTMNWPKCPECGSEDVYYENPRTGSGTYTCCECGHELTTEQAKLFKEWEYKLGGA